MNQRGRFFLALMLLALFQEIKPDFSFLEGLLISAIGLGFAFFGGNDV